MNPFNLFFFLLLLHAVAANTEIIYFSPSRDRVQPGNWSHLVPALSSHNDRPFSFQPAPCQHLDHPPLSCPHQLWVLLDLDNQPWANYATFTLRLSWPASIPADVTIALYTVQDLLDRYPDLPPPPPTSAPTRARYAHISATPTGIVPPDSSPPSPAPLVFFLALEPAYLGVLPATLLPTLGALVLVSLVASVLAPGVAAYLAPYAQQARADAEADVVVRVRKDA